MGDVCKMEGLLLFIKKHAPIISFIMIKKIWPVGHFSKLKKGEILYEILRMKYLNMDKRFSISL